MKITFLLDGKPVSELTANTFIRAGLKSKKQNTELQERLKFVLELEPINAYRVYTALVGQQRQMGESEDVSAIADLFAPVNPASYIIKELKKTVE